MTLLCDRLSRPKSPHRVTELSKLTYKKDTQGQIRLNYSTLERQVQAPESQKWHSTRSSTFHRNTYKQIYRALYALGVPF